MNQGISNAGNPKLFHQEKFIEEDIVKIININIMNWKNLWKSILKKDKYWHNQLRKVYC